MLTFFAVFAVTSGTFALFFLSILIVNMLQKKKPSTLPEILRNWDFLPFYFRSLRAWDDMFQR